MARTVICEICGDSYDRSDLQSVREHKHLEPMFGPPHEAFLASGMLYHQWITETPEGEAWEFRNQGLN